VTSKLKIAFKVWK